MHLLFAIALSVSPARGDDGPAPPDATALTEPAPVDDTKTEPDVNDPVVAIESAKASYLVGDVELARAALEALVSRAARGGVPWEVEAEAWVYLGEIQYLARDVEGAVASFRMVLERSPDHPISPYEHPFDVVGAFETTRRSVLEEREAAARQRVPMPWWSYTPLGVPQFMSGKPARGAVYLTLQVGLGAASIAATLELDRNRRGFDTMTVDEQIAARDRDQLLRSAWSAPTAAAFYATWAASVIDAGVSWRRTRLRSLGVSAVPAPGGASVAVAGRF